MQALQHLDSNHRYSKAVVHGNTVYLAGQVANDPTADVSGQTEQVLAQIDAMLAECGTSKARILSALVLLKNINDLEAVNRIWDAWVPKEAPPARTPFEAQMASPAYLVEIQVVAAI